MKSTNLHLFPDHTYQMRKLVLDSAVVARAFLHKATSEAVLVREGTQLFNPKPIVLSTWAELEALPDPEYIEPKNVSSWAFFTGDNPFLVVTSAGSIIPMPNKPEQTVPHSEIHRQWTSVKQASISTNGVAAKNQQHFMLGIQVVLAGIAALGAIAATLAMLPSIMAGY